MDKARKYPFDESQEDDEVSLIQAALQGQAQKLEILVARHEPWIYNISFRMVLTHEDAKDITQEILIKMVTKLSTYNPEKASFRTWLYRIVVNHIINMKERKYEGMMPSLENYYTGLHQIPDEDPQNSPEMDLLTKDLGIGCVQGILLCLDRRQRLVFILAVVFQISAKQGGDILDITPENFRKILSRSREQLHSFMNNNCGLFNEDAPCHCRKKISSLVKARSLSPDRINFAQPESPQLKDVIKDNAETFNQTFYKQYIRLSNTHPFYKSFNSSIWLREILQKPEFKKMFLL